MIIDGLLVGLGAFGTAAFCFACGFVTGAARKGGSEDYPLTHVSFDSRISDVDRLKFLHEAAEAVRAGHLSKKTLKTALATQQLQGGRRVVSGITAELETPLKQSDR